MSSRSLFTICSSVLLMAGAVAAEPRGQTDELAKIASQDASLRRQGVTELVQKRKEAIRGLIGILQDAQSSPSEEKRGAVVSTIEVLGEIRAAEAADILARFIDYPASNKPVSHGLRPLGVVYPAVEALIKIGNPSLSAVLETLKASPEGDDVVINNAGWIFSQVLSPELAKSYLEMALNAETDHRKQARVRSLLKSLAR